MTDNRTLASYDDVLAESKKLQTNVRIPTIDLLKSVKEFVDTNKISCSYRLSINDKDLPHSGIILGKAVLPKTMLNFLLSKYIAMNKPKPGDKRPTPLSLFGMLLKHQKFNVALLGQDIKCMYPTGTFTEQEAEQEANAKKNKDDKTKQNDKKSKSNK